MSLFNDYQEIINSLIRERQYQDQINYQNWLQEQSNRQGMLKGLTNTAIGAALMYAFPPAGMAAGSAALLGGGLGLMGGSNAMMLPFLYNKGGTPQTINKGTTRGYFETPNQLTYYNRPMKYNLFGGNY